MNPFNVFLIASRFGQTSIRPSNWLSKQLSSHRGQVTVYCKVYDDGDNKATIILLRPNTSRLRHDADTIISGAEVKDAYR